MKYAKLLALVGVLALFQGVGFVETLFAGTWQQNISNAQRVTPPRTNTSTPRVNTPAIHQPAVNTGAAQRQTPQRRVNLPAAATTPRTNPPSPTVNNRALQGQTTAQGNSFQERFNNPNFTVFVWNGTLPNNLVAALSGDVRSERFGSKDYLVVTRNDQSLDDLWNHSAFIVAQGALLFHEILQDSNSKFRVFSTAAHGSFESGVLANREDLLSQYRHIQDAMRINGSNDGSLTAILGEKGNCGQSNTGHPDPMVHPSNNAEGTNGSPPSPDGIGNHNHISVDTSPPGLAVHDPVDQFKRNPSDGVKNNQSQYMDGGNSVAGHSGTERIVGRTLWDVAAVERHTGANSSAQQQAQNEHPGWELHTEVANPDGSSPDNTTGIVVESTPLINPVTGAVIGQLQIIGTPPATPTPPPAAPTPVQQAMAKATPPAATPPSATPATPPATPAPEAKPKDETPSGGGLDLNNPKGLPAEGDSATGGKSATQWRYEIQTHLNQVVKPPADGTGGSAGILIIGDPSAPYAQPGMEGSGNGTLVGDGCHGGVNFGRSVLDQGKLQFCSHIMPGEGDINCH